MAQWSIEERYTAWKNHNQSSKGDWHASQNHYWKLCKSFGCISSYWWSGWEWKTVKNSWKFESYCLSWRFRPIRSTREKRFQYQVVFGRCSWREGSTCEKLVRCRPAHGKRRVEWVRKKSCLGTLNLEKSRRGQGKSYSKAQIDGVLDKFEWSTEEKWSRKVKTV